jgi:hypothetical protein
MRPTVKQLTLAPFSLLLALTLNAGAAPAAADLGPLEPLADLHRAIHESLGLPEPVIVRLLEAGAPEDALPVIGYIAQQAAIAPERVLDLHRRGLPFLDIALRFGLGPEIFYVPLDVDPGPPYGRAWGYYRYTPRARWRSIRLSDAEVIGLVNLRLCTRYYGVPAARVIELRRIGRPYGSIYRDLRYERDHRYDRRYDRRQDRRYDRREDRRDDRRYDRRYDRRDDRRHDRRERDSDRGRDGRRRGDGHH